MIVPTPTHSVLTPPVFVAPGSPLDGARLDFRTNPFLSTLQAWIVIPAAVGLLTVESDQEYRVINGGRGEEAILGDMPPQNFTDAEAASDTFREAMVDIFFTYVQQLRELYDPAPKPRRRRSTARQSGRTPRKAAKAR